MSVTHVEGLSPLIRTPDSDRQNEKDERGSVRDEVRGLRVFEASSYACNPCGDGGAFLIPSCEEDLHDQSQLLQTVSPCNDVSVLLSEILEFNQTPEHDL